MVETAGPLSLFAYSLHCGSFFGLTNSILRILKGNPKKELQWRVSYVPDLGRSMRLLYRELCKVEGGRSGETPGVLSHRVLM